jgi:hypothetical protein
MTEPSIIELITSPLAPGEWISGADLKRDDIHKRLDTVDLTTPVYDLTANHRDFIAKVRESLKKATEIRPSPGR